MLTDIYLIRHGDPARDPAIPYHTPPGPNLSVRGRDEARQVAAFLADKGIEHLFVSPFARTTQTADLIVEALNIPTTFTSLIQEHGPGETDVNVRDRIREVLVGAHDSPYTRIGFVSHGSPVRAFLHELSRDTIDLRNHSYAGGNPAPTCGIWHARRLENGWDLQLIFKPT